MKESPVRNLTTRRLLGLIGSPVEHSVSPVMHQAAIDHLNIAYVYLSFDVSHEDLKSAIEGLKALKAAGINVTIPHKERVIDYMDYLSDDAEAIGAVNTIEFRDGKLIGHNTDAEGFSKSFYESFSRHLSGKKIAIIGSGGAARAVAYQASKENADSVYILSRNEVKGISILEMAERISVSCKGFYIPLNSPECKEIFEGVDILVNASPIGMYPNVDDIPPIDLDRLPNDAIVCDLVYNPPMTELLKAAAARRLKGMNGLGMLLHQGAISFRIWTGIYPPIDVMREALARIGY